MNKIKAIVFDAGDVLFDATLWRKWLYKYLKEKFNLKWSYYDFFYLWDNYYLKEIHVRKLGYNDGFCKFLKQFGLGQEKINIIYQKSFEQKKEIEEKTKPYKWVYYYLPKLKAKEIKIGILTDSESVSEKIKERYKKWDIIKYVDVIVSSADIGTIKPYREAYEFIIEKLGINIEETVFVGHDRDELMGAKMLGLKTINYFDKTSFNSLINELSS